MIWSFRVQSSQVEILLLALFLVLQANGLVAQEQQLAKKQRILHNSKLLTKTLTLYESLQSYRDTTIYEIVPGPRKTMPMLFAFKRPNLLRFESKAPSDIGKWVCNSDGDSVVIYMGRRNEYCQNQAPKVLAQLDTITSDGSTIFHRIVMSDDPFKELSKSVIKIDEVGRDSVDGVPTTILELTLASKDSSKKELKKANRIRLWVGENDFLIHKEFFRLDLSYIIEEFPKEQRPMLGDMIFPTLVLHAHIELNPTYSEGFFIYKAPDNAKRIDELKSISPIK